MKEIRYTLLSDGSSDQVLLNIIKWLLDDLFPTQPFIGASGDLRRLPNPPKAGDVHNRILFADYYYPFDVLFYHRDAESTDSKRLGQRKKEIEAKVDAIFKDKVVCIIPIKLMEAWLLFDEEAIKKAAGNRNYPMAITLPSIAKLEGIQQPKEMLHTTLKEVSGTKSRNLKNFNVGAAVHRVGENIEDYSPLRSLVAFKEFEQDTLTAVSKLIL